MQKILIWFLIFPGPTEDYATTADTLIDTVQTVVEGRKNTLPPLDKYQEDWETPVNTLSGQINDLHQNVRTTTRFDTLHHLFLEQTRLMGELSALFQKMFHAWEIRISQFLLLLKAQDDLADSLSKQLSLSRTNDLNKDAQLVTANKIVAGHQGTQTVLQSRL
jgi:hypothetical protein